VAVGSKERLFTKFEEAEAFCADAGEVLGRKAPPF
jgi:hypothetical protein